MMYTAAVALLAASAALLPEPGIATLRHGAGRGLLEAAEEGGGSPTVTIETEGSQSECTSSANSRTFTAMRNAHVDVVSSLVTAFCDPDFDGFVEQAVNNASDFAVAFATALAETQSECVSMGNAFGCSSASATAAAWARATAQAHANAAAEAVEQCSCDVDLLSLSFTSATTFRELTADVLASAETSACVAGNQESFARAYSSCTAVSYAVVWGRAVATSLVSGGCLAPEVTTNTLASTNGTFIAAEGCDSDDFSFGNALGVAGGSAEGGSTPVP